MGPIPTLASIFTVVKSAVYDDKKARGSMNGYMEIFLSTMPSPRPSKSHPSKNTRRTSENAVCTTCE